MKAEIKSEPTFRCRARDPYQLDNVVETADPVRVAALAARLAALLACAGANAAGWRISRRWTAARPTSLRSRSEADVKRTPFELDPVSIPALPHG